MNTLPVPPHVLRSFNLPIQSSTTAQPLPSGQGNSILLPNSNVVLKHIQDAAEAEHTATVQHQLYNLQRRRALLGERRREYQVAEPLAITTSTTTTITPVAAVAAAPSTSTTINDSEEDSAIGTQRFVAAGTWTAARVIPGTPDPGPGRWEEILRASRALHKDLRELYGKEGRLGELVPFLLFIRQRKDRWAKGDRIAWEMEEGEKSADIDIGNDIDIDARAHSAGETGIVGETYRDIFRQLLSLREPVEMGVSQLVHGDLAGNVLFTNHERKCSARNDERGDDQEDEHEEQEEHVPGIIDFSLYFRPVEFAEAVIVADGLLWYDAGDELVRLVGVDKYRSQMLVRALIFRLVASSEGERERGVVDEAERNRYLRAVGIVQGLIGA
ncbi:hypothetical protein BDBG_08192 [Blastomyces gilchristii SLH14081]|uniref:Aminoglycoside phosphotransferase domain-containing protein n=1 Tax=Blastomyces gilchristii (strain SLH14081) TaxID=559298 RepID=A0A179UXU0_BLAGS|nr:uncharacterized protein BDBG_08192 [Blastomyces gilchristii SLH14081]OAT12904.1 hypothetical protein BDBG_08192 [Blastomyces gilchristii SLH14081]